MPLLNDATTCYVGTQPITTIMAGSVQVWPKGPPPPFRNIQLWWCRYGELDFDTLCTDGSTMNCNNPYMTWDIYPRPANCARGMSYKLESRRHDIVTDWQIRGIFGTSGWRSYLPDSMPNSMAIMVSTEVSRDAKMRFEYRLVYDDGINPAVESEAMRFDPALADSELRKLYLPLEYQENECNGRP